MTVDPLEDALRRAQDSRAREDVRAVRSVHAACTLAAALTGSLARFAAAMRRAGAIPVTALAMHGSSPVGATRVWPLDWVRPRLAVTTDGFLVALSSTDRWGVDGQEVAGWFPVAASGPGTFQPTTDAFTNVTADEVLGALGRTLERSGVHELGDPGPAADHLALDRVVWGRPARGGCSAALAVIAYAFFQLVTLVAALALADTAPSPQGRTALLVSPAVVAALGLGAAIWASRRRSRRPMRAHPATAFICRSCGRHNAVRGPDLCTSCRRKLDRSTAPAVY